MKFNPSVIAVMNKTHISMLERISQSSALELNLNSSSDGAFLTKKVAIIFSQLFRAIYSGM